jgi:hypothetical protein
VQWGESQKVWIVGVDEQQVIASRGQFVLKEMEGYATNVHYFGGIQFNSAVITSVISDELRLRFPLPVIQVTRS